MGKGQCAKELEQDATGTEAPSAHLDRESDYLFSKINWGRLLKKMALVCLDTRKNNLRVSLQITGFKCSTDGICNFFILSSDTAGAPD